MVSGDLKLESLLSQVKRMEEYQELEELAQRTVEAMAEGAFPRDKFDDQDRKGIPKVAGSGR